MIYLSEYKTFDNVQELNHHVKQHTNRRYYDMNETQRQVLQTIAQYSVKYAGASHLKVETIAQAIGKSESTAGRAIRSLVKLNVIKRLNTTRPVSGGKGANIYVILPYVKDDKQVNDVSNMTYCDDDEKTSQAKDTAPIVEKETANLLSYYINSINTYGADARQSLHKHRNTPYQSFKSSIHTFLGDSINDSNKSLVSRLYGVYLGQTKALRKAYHSGELIEIAGEAIRITFTATKRKKLRNIGGYFNGVLSNMLDDMAREEMASIMAM